MTALSRGRVFTSDISSYLDLCLTLAGTASLAFDQFVYEQPSQAMAVRYSLYRCGASELCPPASELLLVDDTLVGMIALLDYDTLQQRRIRTALQLQRDRSLGIDSDLLGRLRLASSTLAPISTGEAYLAYIAVDHAHAGMGYGQLLLDRALERAAESGSTRCVLNVAANNLRARRLYLKSGFAEIGAATVEDPLRGHSLNYVHLMKSF